MKQHFRKFLFSVLLVGVTLLATEILANYQKIDEQILSQRDVRLKVIQRELDEFYLPLQVRIHQSKVSWKDYQKHYGKENIFDEIASGVENRHTLKWQRYMLSVFQPIHIELAHILQKRNLLRKDSKLPESLDLLNVHINQYKVIFSQWKDNEIKNNIAFIHFPKEIELLIEEDIAYLRKEKLVLLAH